MKWLRNQGPLDRDWRPLQWAINYPCFAIVMQMWLAMGRKSGNGGQLSLQVSKGWTLSQSHFDETLRSKSEPIYDLFSFIPNSITSRFILIYQLEPQVKSKRVNNKTVQARLWFSENPSGCLSRLLKSLVRLWSKSGSFLGNLTKYACLTPPVSFGRFR